MINPKFFESKNSLKLFGLESYFKFLSDLYIKQNLPKVLMLTGKKGSGKSTLINHFLFSIFDKKNYDKDNFTLLNTSNIYSQFKNNIFSNIIYVNGSDYQSVKVEDIRSVKSKILQTSIMNNNRFIILDDIDLFNLNSLNALLKIIEEPNKNNYFFLINNKSRPLIDTVKSRTLNLNIILNEDQRIKIINELKKHFVLDFVLNPKDTNLSPGNFVKYNHIFKEHDISPANDYIENLALLLNLYKKNKDNIYKNLVFFITEVYFKELQKNESKKKEKIYENKNFIFDNLNKFLLYNINQNSFINAINNKLNEE
tara:strand:- start:273 stop:1208 length:936 start_codon:yes stop_codon:yes gene_type:complete